VPIRLRLMLVVTAAAVVLAVVGAVAGTWGLRVGLLGSIDQQLRQASAPLRAVVAKQEDSGGGRGRDRGGGGNDRQTQGGGLEVRDLQEQIAATPDALVQVLNPAGGVVAASSGLAGAQLVPAAVRARLGADPVSYEQRVGARGERLRVLAVPVDRADGRYVVAVASSIATADDAVARVRQGALAAGIVLVLGGSLGAWLLAGAALRPVERLRVAVAAVPPDEPGRSLDVPGTRDELAALARTMNRLLDRISQALERERRLIADASHELRTPLTVLRAELELADRPGRGQAELAESVHHAALEATRIAHLAEDLLLLARTDQGAPVVHAVSQPLAPVLRDAVTAASVRAGERDVSVDLEVEPELTVPVDTDRLRQALDNLLDNALRVAPVGSTIRLEAGRRDGSVQISVADSGPGFPEEFLPHAFERFHRADTARTRQHGGAGLGLAIVKAIAQGHGGRAEAANRPDGGAVVRLLLPAS
jgi:two-component system OmpR family sensor kinase